MSNTTAAKRAQREHRLKIAVQFLTELGKGIPDDERVMIGCAGEATTERDATGKVIKGGWWPMPWKPGKDIRTDCNFYACISSSIKTQHAKTGVMRYWRGESSFGHGLALLVDDIALRTSQRGAGSKGLMTVADLAAVLPPTAIVETSPGNTQCLYFMDDPVADIKRFKAFLYCFVNKVLVDQGGDSTVKDVSRYFRAPIGFNNKRRDDGSLKYRNEDGSPWLVRLVEADYSRRYSMEQIAGAFNFRIVELVTRYMDTAALNTMLMSRPYDLTHLKMAVSLLDRAKMGEGSGGAVILNGSGKYRIKCPWGDEHTNGDPYGAYFRGPIPGAEHEFVFGCGHQTCRDARRTWATFVDAIVMPWIISKLEAPNAAIPDSLTEAWWRTEGGAA